MRFIEDQGSSFAAHTRVEEQDIGARGNLFVWGIVIVVLLGLNIGSWAFCSMVFGHPEHPFSYRLLTRMEKLEPLKGFEVTTVPGGRFFTAKDLYARAYPFTDAQLKAYNGKLMRSYLWNYSEREPANFIYGSFIVEQVRAVGDPDAEGTSPFEGSAENKADLFPKGIAITAVADRFPDVKVILILPTRDPVSDLDQYPIGEKFKIGRSNIAATVIFIERQENAAMTLVAVPLVTRSQGGSPLPWQTPSGDTLQLQTPEWLHLN